MKPEFEWPDWRLGKAASARAEFVGEHTASAGWESCRFWVATVQGKAVERVEESLAVLPDKKIPGAILTREIRRSGSTYWFRDDPCEGAPLVQDSSALQPYSVAIAYSAFTSLAALHEEGIHHGLVRPEHLWIQSNGEVLLTKSLIAHAIERDGTTRMGPAEPYYLDPDGWSSTSTLDSASDVFSLALILRDLAVGSHLFRGSEQDQVQAAIDFDGDALWSEDTPELLREALVDCLSPRREERPSAAEVALRFARSREGLRPEITQWVRSQQREYENHSGSC